MLFLQLFLWEFYRNISKKWELLKKNPVPQQENGNELIKNINKIHTTELGIVKIKRNLALQTDDIASGCKQEIISSNEIYKKGKNGYVVTNESVITINANSFIIITAHKKCEKI